MRSRICLACPLLALACTANAAAGAESASPPADDRLRPPPPLAPGAFDSTARTWLQKRPAGNKESDGRQSGPGGKQSDEADDVPRLEAIRVYGTRDPEDYVAAKPPPMLVFRARLERSRPKTPQEITQGALCLAGLCGTMPKELPIDERTRAGSQQSFMPGFKNGTLQ